MLKGLSSRKKNSTKNTKKVEEPQGKIRLDDEWIDKYVESDNMLKLQVEEYQDALKAANGNKDDATVIQCKQACRDRVAILKEREGPSVMGDLINQAKNEKNKAKASEKSKEKKEGQIEPLYDGKEALVTVFNMTKNGNEIGHCKLTTADIGGEKVNKGIEVLVHRNYITGSVRSKIVEGTVLKGVLDFQEDKSTKSVHRYKLLNVAHVSSPESGASSMDIFDQWLKKATVVNTTGLEKITMTEIGAIIRSVPKTDLEAKLEEKFPKGVAVLDGEGPKRILYVEKD